MAMHNTDDIIKVTREMIDQLKKLQINGLTGASIYLVDDHDMVKVWDISSPGSVSDQGSYTFSYDAKKFPVLGGWVQTWRTSPQDYFLLDFPKEALLEAVEEFKEILPEMAVHFLNAINSGKLTHQWNPAGRLSDGILSFDLTIPPTIDTKNIVTKMAEAFNLAYRRFLDLQKAEAQAREAQIEAALERVRAVAMSMIKSEDLLSICEVSFNEFKKLRFDNIRNALIHIQYDGQKYFMDYDYSDLTGGAISKIEYGSHPVVEDYLQKINSAEDAFYQGVIKEDQLEEWKEFRRNSGQIDDPRLEDATAIHYYFFSIGIGDIGISTLQPIDESQIKILKRFRNVFDLAYRRYNDIALAEKQSRESQIELALERVRARTMAMQSSSELKEVVLNLFDGLKSLGVDPTVCNISLIDEKTCDSDVWSAHQTDNSLITYRVFISHFEHPFRKKLIDAFLNKISFSVHELSGNLKKSYIQYLIDHVDYSKVPVDITKSNDKLVTNEEGIVLSAAYMKYGLLIVSSNHAISNDESDILQRFAKIFEQTYTRFLDLQKAEAQTREAQIELSLERIRAQVTAMRESSELLDIVVTMRSEFVSLGHEAHYFWHMRWLPDRYDKAMTSGDGTRIGMVMTLPRHIHGDVKLVADWEKSNEPTLVFAMDVDTAVDYVEKMISLGDFQQVDPQAPTLDDIRHIGGLTFIMARTTHGEIGFSLPGTVSNPPQASVATLARFAGVFDLAYKRFEDLKSTERQHREAQIELALERTRTQSMLMKHSSELNDISKTFHEQLLHLGIDSEFSFVWLPDEGKKEHMFWATWVNEINGVAQYQSKAINYPLDKMEPGTAKCYKDWESTQPVHETYVPPDKIVSFFAEWEELLSGAEKLKPELFPDGIYYTEAYMKYGCFGIDIRRQLTSEEKEIIRRFSVEFERTYTRFLDLQKAEAQNKIIQAENERKTKELEDARQLQLSMLPKELPQLPNLDIAVYMKTATEVGGDYYDFNVDVNGTLTVLVGDATGHGMMSGMMVSIMKSFFIADRNQIELKQFFENANNSIKDMQLGRLMMALAGIQITSEKIIATNAGMPSLLYFRNKSQKAGEFVSNNLPLGGMKNINYMLKEIRYETGDTLLLMSDGFAELKNHKNEQYGYDRLKKEFMSVATKSPKEIIERLNISASEWCNGTEPEDDVTFVVVKVKNPNRSNLNT
jgi:serine phosphatase RsbU (regulator of sigma subunit)